MDATIPAENLIPHAVEVVYRNVPSYLHFSAFYRSLTCEDDSVFEVPANCFWMGETICTDDDFRLYLQTLLFWGLSTLSLDALRFCFQKTEGVYSEVQLLRCYEIMCEVYDDTSSQLSENYAKLFMSSPTFFTTLTTQMISSTLIGKYNNRSHIQILFDFHAISGEGEPMTTLVESHGPCWDEVTCEHAARNAHFDTVQYFIDYGCVWDLGTCYFAAIMGRIDILRNAVNLNTKPTAHTLYDWPDVAAAAAGYGHLILLQFLLEHNFPWDVSACTAAAGEKDLTILQFLIEHGCPTSGETLSAAVARGSLKNVVYMFEQNCPRTADLCTSAMRRRSSDVFIFLVCNGCKMDESVGFNAQTVDSLRFAIDNGCPLADNFLRRMVSRLLHYHAMEGGLPCLMYIVEELLLQTEEVVFEVSMEFGRYSFVQYLVDVGCPFTNAKPFGSPQSRSNHIYVNDEEMCLSLMYAAEHGCNINIEYVQRILDVKYVRCAQYLRAEGVFPEITESPAFISLCERS